MMINMLTNVQNEFPEIFTKQGNLKKREPKKYKCDCNNDFSKTKITAKIMGLTFASPICDKCGKKGKENLAYNVWKRMINHQVEQEDFILNIVQERVTIIKEELEELVLNNFSEKTNALGTLVYFGYLKVDTKKRDKWGIVEYSINQKKNLEKRFELVR